jgi:UDP-N-acetylmuramoylalanine--D-glutamate ligase
MPLEIPTFIRTRIDRPIAVLGGGVSGDGAVALLARIGATTVVYDQNGEEFDADAASRHGLVIFSPGFSPGHSWLGTARDAGCMCIAELDLASLFWRGRILAITGTNGKTTLTEFMTHALNQAGRRALAAGNIGTPFTKVVADEDGGAQETTAVCEVSSFQAEQLGHFYADGLIWTNFAEDHLERHADMASYFAAKWVLMIRTRPGHTFVGSSVEREGTLLGRPFNPGSCVTTEGRAADPGLVGTPFATYPQRENFIVAAAWWKSEGLDEGLLYGAARSFRLARHRLGKVATIDGVTYWNDSKATNFHAVEAALASFSSPVVLIAGGRSKGGNLAGFVGRIARHVSHAVLIGETSPALAAAFESLGVPHSECPSLDEAVRRAATAAGHDGDVLLSPGFASFDMFRNYEDRGDRFEHAVSDLRAARV